MNLKCNLKWLIPKSGKNQNEIANQMGVSKQMFSNWVSGRNYMRVDKAYKLAKILNVKVDDLYEEIDITDISK
ncbi:helix-turn-helix transcriptional regulator [Bacillus solitudinis]|uniref:helix-turn-helix transcriptional regulator n=1 Tax=Bacillus solitudinis TaxID=2014074 RepID=UPI000C232D91|nr:helix-turn-helix transcriptional regulator [Bacillus solitudinis]